MGGRFDRLIGWLVGWLLIGWLGPWGECLRMYTSVQRTLLYLRARNSLFLQKKGKKKREKIKEKEGKEVN